MLLFFFFFFLFLFSFCILILCILILCKEEMSLLFVSFLCLGAVVADFSYLLFHLNIYCCSNIRSEKNKKNKTT